MNYSRRQLEALGEPLGESVTQTRPGGFGRVYGSGGGGPTTSTTYTSNVPEWLRTPTEAVVGAATQEYFNTEDVTDPETGEVTKRITGVKPFTPYSTRPEDYVAGFSPQQQQVFAEAANMYRPEGFGMGTQYANIAAQGGLGAAQQALGYGSEAADIGRMGLRAEALGRDVGQEARQYARQAAGMGGAYQQMATDPRAMQAYMSPYTQNVLELQKEAAIRDAQKANLAYNLGSVRSGTYGGARQLLAQTERERALGSQLQNIQTQGLQDAYRQAQQAQQFGITTGLQGLQGAQAGLGTALQGGQLGLSGIGQAIAGQQAGLQGVQGAISGYGLTGQQAANLANIAKEQQAADVARMQFQGQLGAQQQAQEQRIIDQAIQNYAMAQEYPFQQLSKYSGLLRGYYTPSETRSTYQAYNPAAQVAGTLVQGYGAGRAAGVFKEGGQVKAYAKGGILDAKVFNNPTAFSPEMINKGMQNDSISDVIGAIGLSQIAEARKGAQQSQALSKPAPEGTVLSDLQQQAMGIETLPSGLPAQGLAKGGIIAFSGEDDSLVRAVDEAEMQAGKLDRPGIDTLVREAIARRQAIPMSEDELEAQKFLKSRPEELAKQRQMDRYMALMRFGAGMAGAKTRNFAQALSEGTTAALPVLAEGEKAYRTGITEAMRGRAEMGRAARAEQLKGIETGEAEFRTAQDRYSREETAKLDRDMRKYVADNPQDLVIARAIRKPNESIGDAITRLSKLKQTDEKTYNATAALFGRAMENTNEVLKKAEEPGGVLFRLRTNLDWAKENYPGRVKNQADALKVYQEERNAIIKQEIDRFKETTNIDPSQLGRASGFGARTTPSTRSSAGPQEGQTSKDVNNKPIVYKNGQWVYQ